MTYDASYAAGLALGLVTGAVAHVLHTVPIICIMRHSSVPQQR